jgi:hypothetical protein
MMRFEGRVYTLSPKGLLLWESGWETFRPVHSIVWNPTHNQVEPYFGDLTSDLFHTEYGFGSPDMHKFCVQFTDDHAHEVETARTIASPAELWRQTGSTLQWVRDRPMIVHPESTTRPDRSKFLQRYSLRGKTFRQPPRNLRGTRKIHTHK